MRTTKVLNCGDSFDGILHDAGNFGQVCRIFRGTKFRCSSLVNVRRLWKNVCNHDFGCNVKDFGIVCHG